MTADRKSILLVDNDERSRQLVELCLKKEGYAVTVVAGTIDALVALYGGSFALIIAAKSLADGDGFELLTQCKIDPSLSATPFILITDNAADDEATAIGEGAIGVLGKPVRVKTVVAIVANALDDSAPPPEPEAPVPKLPESALFTVEYRSFVSSIGELPEEANALIRMFDGKRTLGEAIADCDVDGTICRAMIPKLIELGILAPNSESAESVDVFLTARTTTDSRAKSDDDTATRLEIEAREAEEFARRAAENARRAADGARRKAEEARRRAEEERQRRQDEERQRALAEIQELDEEQRAIEENKAAQLEAAQIEANRLVREAEAKAAALGAEARRMASELNDREQSLIDKREHLTARLVAIGADAPAPPPKTTEAVDMARVREREAMEQEESTRTLAFSPGAVTAKLNETQKDLDDSEPHLPAAMAATATAADAADTIPPTNVTETDIADSFYKDSDFYAANDINGSQDELFAEPERGGIPTIWMVMGVLLLLGIIIVLIQGGGSDNEDSEPEPAVTETTPDEPEETDLAEGSAEEGSGEIIDEDAIMEELAAQALEEATAAATDSGLNQADDIEYSARDVAELIAEAQIPVEEPIAATTTSREDRDRTEPTPPRDTRPTETETDADRALEQCANFASSGNYSETIESCQNAVRVNPRSSDAYTYLGKAHYELGDVDSAINFLQQAVRLNARNRTALLALGAARQDAGDNDGAREAYERYLEINPDSRYAAEVRSILETL